MREKTRRVKVGSFAFRGVLRKLLTLYINGPVHYGVPVMARNGLYLTCKMTILTL
jgi:hypothetical protein